MSFCVSLISWRNNRVEINSVLKGGKYLRIELKPPKLHFSCSTTCTHTPLKENWSLPATLSKECFRDSMSILSRPPSRLEQRQPVQWAQSSLSPPKFQINSRFLHFITFIQCSTVHLFPCCLFVIMSLLSNNVFRQ